MDNEPFDPEVETITSVQLSATTKYLLVGLAGAACGLVIGLVISAILADVKSDAPHVPTRARVEETTAEPVDEVPDAVEVNTPPTAEELAKELGIDLTKDS